MGVDIYGQIVYGIKVEEQSREDDTYLLRDEDGESRLEDYWDVAGTYPALHPSGGCETDQYLLGYLVKESYWGEPEELNVMDFTFKAHWPERIKEVCEDLGIEYQEPKFYLTALYSY